MTLSSPRKFPRLVETVGAESPPGAEAHSGTPAPESSPYLAGEVVGDRYRLVREIGRGGMGVVWVAHSLVLGVDVALKLIRASAASSALSSRMAREAHAAARLGHPALVRVFDFGWTRHGDPYLVMELVQGETLAALIRREARMPAIRAVQTLLPIIDGLRLAHDKGIVHRDIKPDNVFLAADALGRHQPKLLDFGIAKVDKQVDGRLTQVGAVLGSPDYMSPEQALGLDDIDERTDVWSLCVVLYEAITGKVPFEKPNYNALMHAIINEEPSPSVERGAGDKGLWQIIAHGLRKQREERFPSVTELGEALALWLYEHGIKEDLSGNSIRAVWLDAALSPSQRELQSRGRDADSASMPRSRRSKAPTLPAPQSMSDTLGGPRSAARRNPALYLGLPAFALMLGAAGAFAAVSLTKARAERASTPSFEPSPPISVPASAPSTFAAPPFEAAAPAATVPARPSAAAVSAQTSKRLAPPPAGKSKAASPRPHRKTDEFGF